MTGSDRRETLSESKVPAVTFGFWIIKIAATTLGETGGDAVTMSLHFGYLLGTVIFATLFAALLAAQLRAVRFRPVLYWAVVVASTTVGTTLSDFTTRSIGIGYIGGSTLLLICVLGSLIAWRMTTGSVAVDHVSGPQTEGFYWLTILFSQTLGTALGDFLADDGGLGYRGGALAFGALLLVVAALYWFTTISKPTLFWAAFILTRPLGATVGDFLDKPPAHGGLGLDRFAASAVLLLFIAICVWLIPQRPAVPRPEPLRSATEP